MSPKVNFYETDPIERGQVRLRPVVHAERAPVASRPRGPRDKSARSRLAAEQVTTRERLALTPRQRGVLNALSATPQRPVEICAAVGLNSNQVGSALRFLASKGKARRLNSGGWVAL